MIDFLVTLYFMDGKGPYVWSSLIFLFTVLGINIFLPFRRMRLIRIESSKGN
jgi:hypothetical protein